MVTKATIFGSEKMSATPGDTARPTEAAVGNIAHGESLTQPCACEEGPRVVKHFQLGGKANG